VDEDDVGLAARGEGQRLAGADRRRLHREACLPLEDRHQDVEQARVLRAGRGRQDDRPGRRRLRRAGGDAEHDDEEGGGDPGHVRIMPQKA